MLEKEKNVVEISDLDPETVDKMLFFMYSEVLEDRNWDSVTKLYVASDKYQIMTLKDKCASILIDQLSPKNACEVLRLADMHCASDFLYAVQDFIIIHDEEILKSEEWKEFMASNSKIACQTMHKAWLHRPKRTVREIV
nr:speckle-type POZ protein-like [Parasteatoda tepidariorum]